MDGLSTIAFTTPARGYDAGRIRQLALDMAAAVQPLVAAGQVSLTSTPPLASGNIKGSFALPGGPQRRHSRRRAIESAGNRRGCGGRRRRHVLFVGVAPQLPAWPQPDRSARARERADRALPPPASRPVRAGTESRADRAGRCAAQRLNQEDSYHARYQLSGAAASSTCSGSGSSRPRWPKRSRRTGRWRRSERRRTAPPCRRRRSQPPADGQRHAGARRSTGRVDCAVARQRVAGRRVCAADVPPCAGVHGRARARDGAGHRRDHGGLHAGRRTDAEGPAGDVPGSPRLLQQLPRSLIRSSRRSARAAPTCWRASAAWSVEDMHVAWGQELEPGRGPDRVRRVL